jgi:hypothetical protein
MKNTLAENLLRFGVKNLSESEKKKIQESEKQSLQEQTVVSDLSLVLKYSIDPATKQKTYSSYVAFTTPINVKGTTDQSYVYESINAITFDLKTGWESINPKRQSKTQTAISGEIIVSANVLTELKKYLNKGKIAQPIKTIGLIPNIKNAKGQIVKATTSNLVQLTVTEQDTAQTPIAPATKN